MPTKPNMARFFTYRTKLDDSRTILQIFRMGAALPEFLYRLEGDPVQWTQFDVPNGQECPVTDVQEISWLNAELALNGAVLREPKRPETVPEVKRSVGAKEKSRK